MQFDGDNEGEGDVGVDGHDRVRDSEQQQRRRQQQQQRHSLRRLRKHRHRGRTLVRIIVVLSLCGLFLKDNSSTTSRYYDLQQWLPSSFVAESPPPSISSTSATERAYSIVVDSSSNNNTISSRNISSSASKEPPPPSSLDPIEDDGTTTISGVPSSTSTLNNTATAPNATSPLTVTRPPPTTAAIDPSLDGAASLSSDVDATMTSTSAAAATDTTTSTTTTTSRDSSSEGGFPKQNFTTTTPAQKCRLDLENHQNGNIDMWQTLGVPSLEGVVTVDDQYYHILLSIDCVNHTTMTYEWTCGTTTTTATATTTPATTDTGGRIPSVAASVNDATSSSVTAGTQQDGVQIPLAEATVDRARKGIMIRLTCPIVIATTTSSNNYTTSGAQQRVTHVWPNRPIGNSNSNSGGIKGNESTHDDKVGVVPVYDLRQFQKCDQLEYEEFLSKKTQNQHNKDNRTVEVGACQILRQGGDESLASEMLEWAVYHNMIGVDHIWVYLNEEWNTTVGSKSDLIRRTNSKLPYVTFVPYNYVKTPQRLKCNYRRAENAPWQVQMQTNCLWQAKKYGLKWIIMTDLDEFIHVPSSSTTTTTATTTTTPTSNTTTTSNADVSLSTVSTIAATNVSMMNKIINRRISPLRELLSQYDSSTDDALIMTSVPFGRNLSESFTVEENDDDVIGDTNNGTGSKITNLVHHRLVVDNVWRKAGPIVPATGRMKLIYNVDRALFVGVHYLWKSVGRQTKLVTLQPEQTAFVQHYKQPSRGVYQAKQDLIVKDARLRDRFKDSILEQMEEYDTA